MMSGSVGSQRGLSKTSTRSPSLNPSSRSWVTMNTVMRVSARSSCRKACIDSRVPGSSAPKGSSSSRIRGRACQSLPDGKTLLHPAR